MSEVNFCYRIEAAAGVAHDEHGNDAECFSKISLDLGRVLSEEECDRLHVELKSHIVKALRVSPDHITPISYVEYAREAEEDDDE